MLAVAGVIGWVGLIWLGVRMYATTPPTAGFDLELLLRAGRSVAAGQSPYDPALIAGTAPVAESLFYSYPPPVAQVLSLLAPVPSGVMLVAFDGAAILGWLVAVALVTRRLRPGESLRSSVLPTLAIAPLVSPYAVGLLFGNLDAFFPLLYGLMLVAALPSSSSRDHVLGGAALAGAALTKLHPASIGLWFLLRGFMSPGARRVVVVATAAGALMVAASLLAGGVQVWMDYAAVLRAGSGADVVDERNAGPAAQLALLVGGGGRDGEALARALQIPVTLAALAGTAYAAWRVRDSIQSLALAAVASLVILPVTWYHYPAALLPFALAAFQRARGGPDGRRTHATLAVAAVLAAVAIAWLPLLWLSAALVVAAVRSSAPASR